MLLFVGELIDVQTGEYNSLVFKSERFDIGLGIKVPCSESVGVSKECLEFIPNFKKHINEQVVIGVNALKTKKGGIFYLATTDVLDIAGVLTNE